MACQNRYHVNGLLKLMIVNKVDNQQFKIETKTCSWSTWSCSSVNSRVKPPLARTLDYPDNSQVIMQKAMYVVTDMRQN